MDNPIIIEPKDYEVMGEEYSCDIGTYFVDIPDIAKPLMKMAKAGFLKIEQMLYSAPAFISAVKASVPDVALQAILTGEQKSQLASGALKLMTKKNGTLTANIIHPKTKKVVSTISLEKVNLSPELAQAMTSYAAQMQMAQIAEQIQLVQAAVEEVRQGQEYDRLATAYSCQQKLLQAMQIHNPQIRSQALLMLVFDAEDSRNLLMQSQNANVAFIKEQPETFWGKLVSGSKPEKISARMDEIRESLCAVNMVSLAAAMAFQELGETDAARQSLQYYAGFIRNVYLDKPGFVERLDLLDESPENYWSKAIPEIEEKIMALPCVADAALIGEEHENV